MARAEPAVKAQPLPSWLDGEPGAWRIAVWVQPGASRTELTGVVDNCLKLRLLARPVEGEANDALVAWFAKHLDCSRQSVVLLRGATSRRKQLGVRVALDAEQLRALLVPKD